MEGSEFSTMIRDCAITKAKDILAPSIKSRFHPIRSLLSQLELKGLSFFGILLMMCLKIKSNLNCLRLLRKRKSRLKVLKVAIVMRKVSKAVSKEA